MKKLLVIGNWKCNPTTSNEAERLFNEIKKGVKGIKNVEITICPPFIYLSNLQLTTGNLQLGAQDCFWEKQGAFTGEVSPLMLKNLGCKYVIIGHSERRRYLKETDDVIAKKLKAVLENRLSPILCIGETKEEKEEERTTEILKTQLENALTNLPTYQLTSLIIAYEPVWAIGTGNFCQPDEAMMNLMFIKKQLLKLLPQKIAEDVRILYGGSVDSKNAKDYIEAGFDGFLIGGASLKAGEFVKIVKLCKSQ